jgi:hypothetical protein
VERRGVRLLKTKWEEVRAKWLETKSVYASGIREHNSRFFGLFLKDYYGIHSE